MDIHEIATELWVLAQLLPKEGVEDGTDRIEQFLKEKFLGVTQTFKPEAHQTIKSLNKIIGQKITNYDISDDHTCIVLLCEDMPTPIITNLFSAKEIKVE
ncbi:MAG: hypothetical protein PHF86_03335 [Candidatus Nanoarchaeia archaeon]|nr:hypothetical protein [Candidatus Nanoarchaeia archaeon]